MRNKIIMIISAILLVWHLPATNTYAATKQFTDVPDTKHFAKAVNELSQRNIIGGYPDNTFRPGNSITRGQAAAIIAKMVKLDMTKVKDPKFKDVSTANGFYKAIAAMAEKKMISGYGDGRFGPNDPITRAQMASILVKAFDLPRYSFSSGNNPFSDVKNATGHNPNILSIYRLGITTGTEPDKFSPNTSITRGQAAKMLLTAEEAKSQIVTIRADEFGWEKYNLFDVNENESAVFNAVPGSDVYKGNTTKLHLVPLKEGKGTVTVALAYWDADTDPKYYRKFYVDVKEVDGKLKLTLERTEDYLPTPAILDVKGKPKVSGISLSTMDGKELDDQVEFRTCVSYSPNDCKETGKTLDDGSYHNVRFDLDKPGQYLAHVKFEDGKVIRYGIEVKQHNSSFSLSVRTLEERTEASVDLGSNYVIGKHVLPKGSENIAEITRDPGSNVFHAVGKKEGQFSIKVPDNQKTDLIDIVVTVQQLGPIIRVGIVENIDFHM